MRMKEKSATHYLLKSLIPYSEPNLKLVFKPSLFFADLAKISHAKQHTLKVAYNRAIQYGLIEVDASNIPRLTPKGQRKIAPFEALHLQGASLMVIFDIPETDRWKRQQFRNILREFHFKQLQKSVWWTKLDCKKYVAETIKDLNLEDCVLFFEARKIKP